MQQPLTKEILDLMSIYTWLIALEDAEEEAAHVLKLIRTLTLSLQYNFKPN